MCCSETKADATADAEEVHQSEQQALEPLTDARDSDDCASDVSNSIVQDNNSDSDFAVSDDDEPEETSLTATASETAESAITVFKSATSKTIPGPSGI